jgi:hypothetical protein
MLPQRGNESGRFSPAQRGLHQMKVPCALLLAVVGCFITATFRAFSHPGSGIVVDAQGRVYFGEAGDIDAHLPGAIWQIDLQGRLTRFHEGGAHYLTLGVKQSFSQKDLDHWFGERSTPRLQLVGASDVSLVQADGQPIVTHRDGSLYYAKGNLEIVRLQSDGRFTPIAPTLDWGKFGGVKGLAFGPDDTLYVECPSAIFKVGTNGNGFAPGPVHCVARLRP